MILDKIVEKKLERIKALKAELPFDNIVEKANNFIIKRRSFFDGLTQNQLLLSLLMVKPFLFRL